MTLLKDNNYKDINVALLSLEADIKKLSNNGSFDTSVIDRQLAEINSRIDKINATGNNSSAEINDIRTEIENINSRLNGNSVRIESIEQKLSDIFSADNEVTDFNTTTDSGIYYWLGSSANKPGTDYGVLLVNKYDSRDGTSNLWVNQVAYGTNNKIYFRQNINSTDWTEWKAVAFDGEGTADKATSDANGNNIVNTYATKTELADKQDFRIFNSLEEFNEKKGTSLTVVSGIDNMEDIANAMSNGEILIILVRYELGSDVYFGLTADTGWTKMFTFIKSNGLCDVECRTTYPLTIKRVLNSDGVVGDWQQLVTMDKLKPEVGFITGSLLSPVITGSNLYYQKFGDGRLFINGWVKLGAVSVRTKLFTLPNNWKASSNYLLPCYVDRKNIACACMVNITEGDVFAYTPIPATNELRFCGTIYLM